MRTTAGPVTKFIAGVNVALALIVLIPGLFSAVMVAGALIPARFTMGDAILGDAGFLLPVWLTPVSSAFLHGGLLHASLNMLMLLMVGANIERVLGSKAYTLLYAAGLVAAAAAEVAANPLSPSPIVGASGAISALFAAHMMLFPRNRPQNWKAIPGKWVHAAKLLVGWVAFNLMLGFAAPGIGLNIAIWAHIGGFVAGLVLTWPLLNWRYRNA
jgi:membrane associated rhomboid family serine protease